MQPTFRFSTPAIMVLASSLAACLANPATGVAPNGGALRVQYSSGTGTYVSNDKTGEDVTTHDNGNQSVTEHFEPVQHSYRWTDWKYFQGREELDEQDFYRIAGDQPAVRRIDDIRGGAALKMKIGVPLLILGLGAGLVSTTLRSSAGNQDLSTLGYVGGVVGLAGGLVWYWGHGEMENRHHLPAAQADEHADVIEDCNGGRCTQQRGGRGKPPRTSDVHRP